MANLFWLSGRAYENSSGVPYALATASFFVTGTTTAQDTYTSASLGTANANPVVSGADGVFPDIYLAAKRYKVVIKDADGVTLRTWDPVDADSQIVTSASAPSPTFPLLYWYDTTTGNLKRRKSDDSDWISLGGIDSLINASSVTEAITGTATDKSMTPDSTAALWQRGTDITPSAGSISLPSTGGKHFNLAAGNFSACSSTSGGREIWLHAQGVSVVTHNATSMECDGAGNITTAAGDILVLINKAAADATGANYRVHLIKKSGNPAASISDFLASQSDMETNTSTTKAPSVATVRHDPGVCKGWVNFTIAAATTASQNVTSITDTGTAKWAIVWGTDFSSAAYCCVTGSEATANNETAVDTLSAGGVNVKMYRSDDTNTAETNSTASHVAAFGDQ